MPHRKTFLHLALHTLDVSVLTAADACRFERSRDESGQGHVFCSCRCTFRDKYHMAQSVIFLLCVVFFFILGVSVKLEMLIQRHQVNIMDVKLLSTVCMCVSGMSK